MLAPAHLLLIDPDEVKRDLLRKFLGRQGFLVSAARDCGHAARLLEGLDFDLIVVEASEEVILPERTPVISLVDAGAKARGETLEKPFEPATLVERINTVLDRMPPPEEDKPEVLRFGPFRYTVETAVLAKGGERVKLTATEVKLMRALARRPSAPITRAELADEVEADPMSRAVDVQITRLRRKIERDPKNPTFLQTVRGTGYMLALDK